MKKFDQNLQFSNEEEDKLEETKRKIIADLESKKVNLKKIMILIVAIYFITPILVAIFKNHQDLLLIIVFILSVIYILKNNTRKKKQEQHYTRQDINNIYAKDVIETILKKVIPEAEFSFSNDINKVNDLIRKDVLPSGNRGGINWQIDATKSKEYHFFIANAYVEFYEQSDDSAGQWETRFSGTVFEFPCKKPTNHPVKIVASKEEGILKKETTGFYSPKTKEWRKIETESVEFNKNFEVYAESDVDGFIVLSPDFMEDLLKLKEEYGIFACYATENEFIIAINQIFGNISLSTSPKSIEALSFKTEYSRIKDILDKAVELYNIVNNE